MQLQHLQINFIPQCSTSLNALLKDQEVYHTETTELSEIMTALGVHLRTGVLVFILL